MSCSDFNDRLDDYLDATLDPATRQSLESHLTDCAVCRSKLAAAEALIGRLRALPVDPPPTGFEERLLRNVMSPRRAAPRLIGATVTAALAAGIAAVALLGPPLDRPNGNPSPGLPSIAMTVEQPRTINLVFAASMPLQDVSLQVALPAGFEIPGYEGLSEVNWRTSLRAGKNVLPLELVARNSASGEIVARMRSGNQERIFRVSVTATTG